MANDLLNALGKLAVKIGHEEKDLIAKSAARVSEIVTEFSEQRAEQAKRRKKKVAAIEIGDSAVRLCQLVRNPESGITVNYWEKRLAVTADR